MRGAIDQIHITGMTRLIAMIGDPVLQARSPMLFNALFMAQGHDAVCIACELPTARFVTGFAGLISITNLDGIFVTAPHKQSVVSLTGHLSPTAARLGAVNVVRRGENGTWYGDMFDGVGTVLALRWEGIELTRKHVLLVGAGGAGRAIGLAVAEAGAASITIVDTRQQAADDLASLIRERGSDCRINPAISSTAPSFDVCINASLAGMKPDDPSPVEARWISEHTVALDLTGEPDATPLGRLAQQLGAKALGGTLVHQGQAVFAAKFLGFDYWPADRPHVTFGDLLEVAI